MKQLVLIVACLLPGVALAQAPHFTDRAAGLPVAHVYDGGWEHFVGGGVAVFDCNGDGMPEIFAAGGTNPARLFINKTPAPGAPLTFSAGDIEPITGATGAYPLDVDSDGWLDLVVLRVGPNRFLKGGPGCTFEDAADRWGLVSGDRWSTAFSATWEPGQTLPTLAIGNYVDRSDPDGPFGACDRNTIYRPDGAHYAPPRALSPGYCPLSMLFSDYSRRGRADLRLSNDRHYYLKGGSEQMWRPEENRFLGPRDGWQPLSIWGMGIASRDLNGDLKPDVMLTSMGDQLLQFSTPQGYRNAPFDTGATAHRPFQGDDGRPSTGWHAAFGDVNDDGLTDIFIAKGNVDQMPGSAMHDPNNLLMAAADGHYTEAADSAGIASMTRSRGAALTDLNADGLLDLVVVNRRAPMELWQNVTRGGDYVAIDLQQSGSNPRAVGAWVELRASGTPLRTQERTVGGGHASGTAAPLHFGTGAADTAMARVIWPDGVATDWISVPANRTTTLTRSAPR